MKQEHVGLVVLAIGLGYGGGVLESNISQTAYNEFLWPVFVLMGFYLVMTR